MNLSTAPIEINTIEGVFDPVEWIGAGRLYPVKDVPDYLSNAKGATLTIPPVVQKLLPLHSISVLDFLAMQLPDQSNELVTSTPHSWFSKELELIVTAQVDSLRPLKLDDYGIVYAASGLHLAQVIVMYSKAGGKYGNHGARTDSSSISGISFLGVRIYEPRQGQLFSAIPDSNALLGTARFEFVQPFRFLLKLPRIWITVQQDNSILLHSNGLKQFKDLQKQEPQIKAALKAFTARKKATEMTQTSSDDED